MTIRSFLFAFLLAAFFSCGESNTADQDETTDTIPAVDSSSTITGYHQLSPEEQEAGWVLLFDGATTEGWHGYLKGDSLIAWTVENGELRTSGGNGDLTTDKEYANFELAFDFNISPKGNSGVIYRVVEDEKYSAPYLTGPEYQIVDDAGFEGGVNPKHQTGANYDVHAPATQAVLPAGEWNTGRIIVNGNEVEHWLNGKKVVEYELASPEWEKAIAASKWAEVTDYGRAEKGRIDLQDHGDAVAFRNIKIREL